MSATIEIKGIDALKKKLKRNATLSDVRKTLSINGATMQQNAQRFAAVDTGNLKRNIHIRKENGGMTIIVSSDAEYAGYQEYGTRFMSGTPHVRPAYKIQAAIFRRDMQRLVR